MIEKSLHQGIKDELKDDFLKEVITQVVSQQPGNVTVSLQADQLEALSSVAAKLVSSSRGCLSRRWTFIWVYYFVQRQSALSRL